VESKPNLVKSAKIQRSIASSTDEMVARLIRQGTITEPKWWVSQRGRPAVLIVALGICGIGSIIYQVGLEHRSNPGYWPS
jgi:hypothetical protein